MHAANFASTFAPYAPPPDDRPATPVKTMTPRAAVRPWFPVQSEPSSSSYQSGGLPTLGTSYGGGGGVVLDGVGGVANGYEEESAANQWETRYGARVDILAALAYVFGPISALVCLILETHNDYVRFHAYQSALVTTPIVFFRIFGALVGFPSFLNTLFTLWIIVTQGFMAFRAYIDAAQNNLTRFHLPLLGLLAEQWVQEE